MEQKATIQVSLSPEDAYLLALFLKRLDSGSVRQKAANDAEADDMSTAITSLRNELADQGFDPR